MMFIKKKQKRGIEHKTAEELEAELYSYQLRKGFTSAKVLDDLANYGLRRSSISSQDSIVSAREMHLEGDKKHWLLDNRGFITMMYLAIILSSIQMGLRIDFPEFEDFWEVTENIFTGIFATEVLLKFAVLRCSLFRDRWNVFDIFLVLLAVVDNWIVPAVISQKTSGDEAPAAISQLPALRVLRVLRIARLARLIRIFKELGMIMTGIVDSLRTIFWVVFLLVLMLYCCSIFCVHVIGRETMYPGFGVEEEQIVADRMVMKWNNHQYFGTISRSMFSLFNIILLTEVESIGRPVYEYQPFMIVFFIIFIVYTTFGVLNVIVGVIVDNTMAAAKAVEEDDHERIRRERLGTLKTIRHMLFSLDKNEDGVIDLDELTRSWNDEHCWDLLRTVNLPVGWSADDFMYLLDKDGNGLLEFNEFLACFYQLMSNDQFQQHCTIHSALNHCKHMVFDFEKKSSAAIDSLDDKLNSLDDKLEAKTSTINIKMDVIADHFNLTHEIQQRLRERDLSERARLKTHPRDLRICWVRWVSWVRRVRWVRWVREQERTTFDSSNSLDVGRGTFDMEKPAQGESGTFDSQKSAQEDRETFDSRKLAQEGLLEHDHMSNSTVTQECTHVIQECTHVAHHDLKTTGIVIEEVPPTKNAAVENPMSRKPLGLEGAFKEARSVTPSTSIPKEQGKHQSLVSKEEGSSRRTFYGHKHIPLEFHADEVNLPVNLPSVDETQTNQASSRANSSLVNLPVKLPQFDEMRTTRASSGQNPSLVMDADSEPIPSETGFAFTAAPPPQGTMTVMQSRESKVQKLAESLTHLQHLHERCGQQLSVLPHTQHSPRLMKTRHVSQHAPSDGTFGRLKKTHAEKYPMTTLP